MSAAGFALAVAGAAGILFGVLPALHIGRGVAQDTLRGTGRGSVTTANRRTRHALVVVEIALSTILTIGASLLIQTFVRLSRVETGLRPASVVAVNRIELPRSRASLTRSGAFFEQLIDRIHAARGVDAAAVTIGLPLDRRARFFVDDSTFTVARRPAVPVGQRPSAALHVVSAEYFAAVGIPLERGRWFDARDRADAPAVVVINEAMARRYWPGEGSDWANAHARPDDSPGTARHAPRRRHRRQRASFRTRARRGTADVHSTLADALAVDGARRPELTFRGCRERNRYAMPSTDSTQRCRFLLRSRSSRSCPTRSGSLVSGRGSSGCSRHRRCCSR